MSNMSVRILGGFGWSLIAAGTLVLLFAGFQLWGTGLTEARAQSTLDQEFDAALQRRDAALPELETAAVTTSTRPNITSSTASALEATTTTVAPTTTTTLATTTQVVNLEPQVVTIDPNALPSFGEAAGRIFMPTIGVTKTFLEGVARSDLRLGPGHYPTTPLPGQPGNAAIAGHRTTHGSPFFDIDKLEPGDEIVIQTLQGMFVYEVEPHSDGRGGEVGHFIVSSTASEVLANTPYSRLTLTACHPKYSAAKRIIVTAKLVSQAAPATPIPVLVDVRPQTEIQDATIEEPELVEEPEDDPVIEVDPEVTESEDEAVVPGVLANSATQADGDQAGASATMPESVSDSLGWQPQNTRPTALWAFATAMVAFAAWVVGRLWRRWIVYALAAPLFFFCLFFCFTYLDRLLPAV